MPKVSGGEERLPSKGVAGVTPALGIPLFYTIFRISGTQCALHPPMVLLQWSRNDCFLESALQYGWSGQYGTGRCGLG